jgi:hypothetical protein
MLVAFASISFRVFWIPESGAFTFVVSIALMLAALELMELNIAAIVDSG